MRFGTNLQVYRPLVEYTPQGHPHAMNLQEHHIHYY